MTVEEPNDEEVGEEAMYETVVVANRLPEDPFVSDRSSNVVDSNALSERAPRTTPEALWQESGVFVQQTNHGGGSPIIRGLIGPQNLVLIDGVRLNNSVYRTGPTQYLNLIDPLSLERIEVLRGPGSVLYGSDAMGGVIQAVTLSPPPTGPVHKALKGRVLGRYASANRGRTAHGFISGSACGTGALGGISAKVFDDLAGGREVGIQPYSGYDTWSALGHLGHTFYHGPLKDLSVKAVYISTRINRAGRTDKLWDKQQLQLYDNADDLVYTRVSAKLHRISTVAEATASYQHFGETKDNIAVAEDLETQIDTARDEVTAQTVGADLKVDSRFLGSRLVFQYGGMFYRDFVDAGSKIRQVGSAWQELTSSVYPSGSTYDTYGVYLLARGDILSTAGGHILRIKGGYRFHGMGGHAPANRDLREVDIDTKGHVFSATLQYLYRGNATVVLNFSQGFRAPNLAEAVMLGDTGKFFHIPNDALKPERSDTLELLTRIKAGSLRLGAAGYVSFIDDLITRQETTWQGLAEVNGKPVIRNVNTKEGILWGVEGALGAIIGAGFSANGSLTYTWGSEIIPDADDIPLSRIPPLFGRVELRYDAPAQRAVRGFAATDLLGAVKQDRLSVEDETDARIPEGGTPGWTSWNVGVGATLWDHLELQLRVENLLNEKYKYHGSGVYAPGTNAILTVRSSF